MSRYRELFHQGRLALSLSILLSSMLVALDVLIVNTVLPQILKSLGGTPYYAWAIGVYSLGAFVTIPIASVAMPRLGPRRTLIVAMSLFLLGAICGGLAKSMLGIVLGRFLQGLGAGGYISTPFGLIAQHYPPELQPQAVGAISAIWGLSAVAGPLVGAAILKALGWPWIFWFNIPIGLLILGLSLYALRNNGSDPQAEKRFNCLGPFLFALGTAIFLEACSRPLPFNLLGLALSLFCFGLFFRHEKRHPLPILPLDIFSKTSLLGAGFFGMALVAMSFGGIEAFLPLLLQGLWGLSSLQAGFILTVGSLSWAFSSVLAARWAKCPRALGQSGNLFLLLGLLGLSVVLHWHLSKQWIYVAWLFAGIGIGQIVPVYNTLAMDLAQGYNPGMSSGALLLAMTWGFSVGPTLVGVFANLGFGKDFDPKTMNGLPLAESAAAALRQGGLWVLGICLILACLSLFNAFRLPKRRQER